MYVINNIGITNHINCNSKFKLVTLNDVLHDVQGTVERAGQCVSQAPGAHLLSV